MGMPIPSCALIAKTEDSFAIAYDDTFHAVVTGMAEDLFDAILVGVAEEQAAGFPPDLTEALATLADRRSVDQRQHLLDIADNQCVEQRFVGVLEVTKEIVFVKLSRLVMQSFEATLDLVVEGCRHVGVRGRADGICRARGR